MTDINALRSAIDRIDSGIQRLFEERMEVSAAIGEYKAARGLPVFDAAREAEKIEELKANAASLETAEGIAKLYETIFCISRELQERMKGGGAPETDEAARG